MGIKKQKITSNNPARFAAPWTVNIVTAINLAGIRVASILPGFEGEIEKVETFARGVTAAITLDAKIGAISVLTGAVTPVADTIVSGAMVADRRTRRFKSTDAINLYLTTDGTGAATNLEVRVWFRGYPLNEESHQAPAS